MGVNFIVKLVEVGTTEVKEVELVRNNIELVVGVDEVEIIAKITSNIQQSKILKITNLL